MAPPRRPIEQRIAENASVDDSGCWVWQGHRSPDGYGLIGVGRNNTMLRVHRVTFERLIRPLREGEIVCHRCDNPSCCNPEHLFAGSHGDNMRDMSLKGRATNQHGGQQQTHCRNGHEYTPENTYWRPGKIASRDCRACIRLRAVSYQKRKSAA